jgi:hypothetical protein
LHAEELMVMGTEITIRAMIIQLIAGTGLEKEETQTSKQNGAHTVFLALSFAGIR